jgi:hypothetical protein
VSREVQDHRRRILDHQEKVAAQQRAPAPQSADPQLQIPLIGEVRRSDASPPKRKRPRLKKPIQPKLEEF